MLISTRPPPTSCKAAEDLHEGPDYWIAAKCRYTVVLLLFDEGGVDAALSSSSDVGCGA